MRYRHIIWDWNGTLLNDRQLCVEAINKLLIQRDKNPLSEADYLAKFDFPVRDYYVKAGFDFSQEDFSIPALEFIDLYNQKRKECQLQANALEVLQHFKNKGIGQSLLSASEAGILEDMVSHFNLNDYFQTVTGLDNHYATSKLELGQILVKKIGFLPEEILMIGDTCHDQDVAVAMGVDVVLYDQGHFPRYRLTKKGVKVISDLGELIM